MAKDPLAQEILRRINKDYFKDGESKIRDLTGTINDLINMNSRNFKIDTLSEIINNLTTPQIMQILS